MKKSFLKSCVVFCFCILLCACPLCISPNLSIYCEGIVYAGEGFEFDLHFTKDEEVYSTLTTQQKNSVNLHFTNTLKNISDDIKSQYSLKMIAFDRRDLKDSLKISEIAMFTSGDYGLAVQFLSMEALNIFCGTEISALAKSEQKLFYTYYYRDLSTYYNAFCSTAIQKYLDFSSLKASLLLDGLSQTQVNSLCKTDKAFCYRTNQTRADSTAKNIEYYDGTFTHYFDASNTQEKLVTLAIPRTEVWLTLAVILALTFVAVSLVIVKFKGKNNTPKDEIKQEFTESI